MAEVSEIDELSELALVCQAAQEFREGGRRYIHLGRVKLPNGCVPQQAEGLLCLNEHDGYPTRLFLSQRINRGPNWSTHRILDRAWHTWSWRGVTANQRAVQILAEHLRSLR